MARGLWLGLSLASTSSGCASDGGEGGPCTQGETQPCVCAEGDGAQSCLADETWGACMCGSSGSSTEPGSGSGGEDSAGTGGDSSGSDASGEDASEDTEDAAGCEPGVPTLAPGESVALASAGPGQTTGLFCILVPDEASQIVFNLSSGTCDMGACQFEEVRLFFREGASPDHTNPDAATTQWSYEVSEDGFGEFGRAVEPGPAYLVTDDGANGFGYSGVALSVAFGADGGGENRCQRIPELDALACPPGFPPAAYDCFDAPPPPECAPAAGGPEVCCPA